MDDDLIDTAEIARMLGLSKRNVAERTTHQPDFPAPFRYATARRWKRQEVVDWIESTREKRHAA